jgi:serine/threonine protein kinase
VYFVSQAEMVRFCILLNAISWLSRTSLPDVAAQALVQADQSDQSLDVCVKAQRSDPWDNGVDATFLAEWAWSRHVLDQPRLLLASNLILEIYQPGAPTGIGRANQVDRSETLSLAPLWNKPVLTMPRLDLALWDARWYWAPRLRVAVVPSLAYDLLRSLQALHNTGLIHRDVSPTNVMVDRKRRAYLIDMGGVVPFGSQFFGRVNDRGMSAPEVLRNEMHRPASDVWAVACTLAYVALENPLVPLNMIRTYVRTGESVASETESDSSEDYNCMQVDERYDSDTDNGVLGSANARMITREAMAHSTDASHAALKAWKAIIPSDFAGRFCLIKSRLLQSLESTPLPRMKLPTEEESVAASDPSTIDALSDLLAMMLEPNYTLRPSASQLLQHRLFDRWRPRPGAPTSRSNPPPRTVAEEDPQGMWLIPSLPLRQTEIHTIGLDDKGASWLQMGAFGIATVATDMKMPVSICCNAINLWCEIFARMARYPRMKKDKSTIAMACLWISIKILYFEDVNASDMVEHYCRAAALGVSGHDKMQERLLETEKKVIQEAVVGLEGRLLWRPWTVEIMGGVAHPFKPIDPRFQAPLIRALSRWDILSNAPLSGVYDLKEG